MTPDEPPELAEGKRVPATPSPTRSSRRKRGEDPDFVNQDDLDGGRLTKERKMLLTKGGRGGRIHEGSHRWEYFPTQRKDYLSRAPKEWLTTKIFLEILKI